MMPGASEKCEIHKGAEVRHHTLYYVKEGEKHNTSRLLSRYLELCVSTVIP